jgi:hypothetical protein
VKEAAVRRAGIVTKLVVLTTQFAASRTRGRRTTASRRAEKLEMKKPGKGRPPRYPSLPFAPPLHPTRSIAYSVARGTVERKIGKREWARGVCGKSCRRKTLEEEQEPRREALDKARDGEIEKGRRGGVGVASLHGGSAELAVLALDSAALVPRRKRREGVERLRRTDRESWGCGE